MSRILLVNDDGIKSIGLLTLKKELENIGEILVVAPRNKMSGAGKSLTFHNIIRVEKTVLSDGSKGYSIDGTPADAVMIGLYKLSKKPPDLLVSGINLGHNMNIDDIFSSGTLGAAFEGAIHNIPSLAVSCFVHEVPSLESDGRVALEELKMSAKIARKASDYILKNGMPEDVDVISINVPENADDTKIKITNISYLGYSDIYLEHKDGYIVKCNGGRFRDEDSETDVYTINNERVISITPITLRFPHKRERMKELREFLISSLKQGESTLQPS